MFNKAMMLLGSGKSVITTGKFSFLSEKLFLAKRAYQCGVTTDEYNGWPLGVVPNVTLDSRHLTGLYMTTYDYGSSFDLRIDFVSAEMGDEEFNPCPSKILLINHTVNQSWEIPFATGGLPTSFGTGGVSEDAEWIEALQNTETEQVWEIQVVGSWGGDN